MAKQIDEDKKQLILVTKEDEWDKAEKRLKECMDEAVKVVGLDCEFMVKRNTSMPSTYDCQAEENAVRAKAGQVVLLQLSSCGRGVVTVLVRLCYLNRIPGGLAEFLTADDIFKVGVNIDEDCRRLHRDYGLFVRGWLDLRYLCFGSDEFRRIHNGAKCGLKTLATELLGSNKFWPENDRVRYSNWSRPLLSNDQISYAAADAYVAIMIFLKLIREHFHKPEQALTPDDVNNYLLPYVHRSFGRTMLERDQNVIIGRGRQTTDDTALDDSDLELNQVFSDALLRDTGLKLYDENQKLRCRLRHDVVNRLLARSRRGDRTIVHFVEDGGDEIIEVELRRLKR